MADAPSILAVDFSRSNTGIAFGRTGEKPILSSKKFAAWEYASIGEIGASVLIWINDLTLVYKPDILIIEAALAPAASRDQMSARYALGADFMIKAACCLRKIRCEEVAVGTWRAWLFGNGRMGSAQAKALGMKMCRDQGLEPKNNDESDAGCVWFWAEHEYGKFRRDNLIPLFAKSRAAA